MKLGIIYDGQRNFLEELAADWQTHFDTSVFEYREINWPVAKGRINPRLYHMALKRFIDQQDVVFFEWVGAHLATASRLKPRRPIIARLHSWEIFHHAQQVNWNAVTRVVLVSEAMRRRFIELFPNHANKTVVLPAGKSLTRFAPVPHPFRGKLAMLGNIIPIKRVYEMVLTLAELRRQGHDFTLHLAGKPESGFNNQRYYASLVRAVEKLGLQEQVIFHGWVNSAEWLPEMDIFISNSYWEGQQNALIEAMACGCYCLSHFWDGAEEILPRENLYATDQELIEKIVTYSKMPEPGQQELKDCLRSLAVKKYDLADSLDRYRALISSTFQESLSKQ